MTIEPDFPNNDATDSKDSPVRLIHHGAAAANHNHAVAWIEDPRTGAPVLVYASHCILNFARRATVATGQDGSSRSSECAWSVEQTLRSRVQGGIITCLESIDFNGLVCGFSTGTVSLWCRKMHDSICEWTEHVLIEDEQKRSITVVTALFVQNERLLVASGSSGGATLYTFGYVDNAWSMLSSKALLHTAVTSIVMVNHSDATNTGEIFILLGTAFHRHNKIHVWHQKKQYPTDVLYSGSLAGHEDWISSLCWKEQSKASSLLASGSQDCKIRLWKFVTRNVATTDMRADSQSQPALQEADSDDNDSNHDAYFEQEEEGESRLEISYLDSTVSVFLEALMIGHEGAVTSVVWHPDPLPIYGQEMVLISSSLDRSILLWAPSECSIWTPLTRVGSAGGILGGPISSSLLGFCSVVVEPGRGHCLVAHAYGGALHMWTLKGDMNNLSHDESQKAINMSSSLFSWAATPGITGHFSGVTDLCWEACHGRYLLTVGNDQTCRLWSRLKRLDNSPSSYQNVWLEIARPQVHGYNLSSVTSVSTPRSPHRIVSGAEEKELRVFDAPLSTLRLLSSTLEDDTLLSDADNRVERAYIPSLGLSNKATVADGAEEDNVDEMLQDCTARNKLPLERDLGTQSIWPEVQKLFGHQSELYCLASTCAAQTSGEMYQPTCRSFLGDVMVASSTKARDAESASIRIWDMKTCKCEQALSDGHKSTVATLSFSPDGQYLISSGKDRRLCLWQRSWSSGRFSLVWAKDSAHKRIIWSVHACPFDETIFASGSRDGCINVWVIRKSTNVTSATQLCSFVPLYREGGKPDAVTALSFAPRRLGPDMILAVGLEAGYIELWKLSIDAEKSKATFELFFALPSRFCHSSRVCKLAWRPCHDAGTVADHVLASCSMDHGCRLFSVDLSSER